MGRDIGHPGVTLPGMPIGSPTGDGRGRDRLPAGPGRAT